MSRLNTESCESFLVLLKVLKPRGGLGETLISSLDLLLDLLYCKDGGVH